MPYNVTVNKVVYNTNAVNLLFQAVSSAASFTVGADKWKKTWDQRGVASQGPRSLLGKFAKFKRNQFCVKWQLKNKPLIKQLNF